MGVDPVELTVETRARTEFVPLLPVRRGALALGRWQEIFFCEFDGPRTRTVRLAFLSA